MRAILTYHSVDDGGSMFAVSPETFRCQMHWLARSGIRAVSVDEIFAMDDRVDAIAVTFDDGLESFALSAYPALCDAGIPSAVYVITALANGLDEWNARDLPIPPQRLLDWDTIGRLSESGVTIGSHTRTHADLSVAEPAVLADEIEGSQRDIEAAIGARATSFAYPYGNVSTEALRLVRSCYSTACTTDLRAIAGGDDAHLLPRLDMYYFREPGQLEAWGSPHFLRRLRLHAWARKLHYERADEKFSPSQPRCPPNDVRGLLRGAIHGRPR